MDFDTKFRINLINKVLFINLSIFLFCQNMSIWIYRLQQPWVPSDCGRHRVVHGSLVHRRLGFSLGHRRDRGCRRCLLHFRRHLVLPTRQQGEKRWCRLQRPYQSPAAGSCDWNGATDHGGASDGGGSNRLIFFFSKFILHYFCRNQQQPFISKILRRNHQASNLNIILFFFNIRMPKKLNCIQYLAN